MRILEAMQKTIDKAKSSGQLCYLYKRKDDYFISSQREKGWIFQAYPGGRKILSAEGDRLVKEDIK